MMPSRAWPAPSSGTDFERQRKNTAATPRRMKQTQIEPAELPALVAAATVAPLGAIELVPRPALSYSNNQLYDAWADSRHLIVKAFTNPAEQHAGGGVRAGAGATGV